MQENLANGDSSGATSVDDDLQIGELLAGELACVDHGSGDNDGSAVLIIVENGEIKLFDESPFDVEALGCLDVLEIDSAEDWEDLADDVEQFLWVLFLDADWDQINSSEQLEETALSLHDWESGIGANVPEA